MNRRHFLTLAGGAALVPVVPAAVNGMTAVQAENLRMLREFQQADLYSKCVDGMLRTVASGLGIPYEQLAYKYSYNDGQVIGWHIEIDRRLDPVRT